MPLRLLFQLVLQRLPICTCSLATVQLCASLSAQQ
jgi:hypothetical protein